jgi:hypothetical protein
MAAAVAVNAGVEFLPADRSAGVRAAEESAQRSGLRRAEIVFTGTSPNNRTLTLRLIREIPWYVAVCTVGLPGREISVTASAHFSRDLGAPTIAGPIAIKFLQLGPFERNVHVSTPSDELLPLFTLGGNTVQFPSPSPLDQPPTLPRDLFFRRELSVPESQDLPGSPLLALAKLAAIVHDVVSVPLSLTMTFGVARSRVSRLEATLAVSAAKRVFPLGPKSFSGQSHNGC